MYRKYMVSAVITDSKGWTLDMFGLAIGDRVEGFLCNHLVQNSEQEVQVALQVQVSKSQLITVGFDADSIELLN